MTQESISETQDSCSILDGMTYREKNQLNYGVEEYIPDVSRTR